MHTPNCAVPWSWCFAIFVGCSTAGRPAVDLQHEPAAKTSTISTSAPTITQSTRATVSAEPDPLRAEDETKIAQLLAKPSPIIEKSPRLSPDGKRAAFVANYDGEPALYLAEIGASSKPRKITGMKERFRRPVFSPDGKHIYFTTDTRGNEA